MVFDDSQSFRSAALCIAPRHRWINHDRVSKKRHLLTSIQERLNPMQIIPRTILLVSLAVLPALLCEIHAARGETNVARGETIASSTLHQGTGCDKCGKGRPSCCAACSKETCVKRPIWCRDDYCAKCQPCVCPPRYCGTCDCFNPKCPPCIKLPKYCGTCDSYVPKCQPCLKIPCFFPSFYKCGPRATSVD